MPKKRKSIFRSIVIPVLLLAVTASAVYYINEYFSHPKFVRYPAFGIDIPANYAMHGIDVSRYQNNIDWKAVSSMQDKQVKIGFAFIKATEGLDRVDDKFRQNWFKVKQTSLPRGAYHFFICSKSGKAQAENFIETVSLTKGDLPPVLDIESANGASVTDIQQRAKDWLTMIEQHYKIRPIIYTNVDFYENFLQEKFDTYPLWVAHYYVKNKPAIKRNWTFWQHNEKGRVNGVDAYVDFNVFNGDSAGFRKMLLK
ncbi:MAG: GH25 family lysozyme [Ferruginibacter sp.]